jgi:hypothetical protein
LTDSSIEKKVPINCEDIQYIQEELTDSDYEDDDDDGVDTKEKTSATDISQLQNQLISL